LATQSNAITNFAADYIANIERDGMDHMQIDEALAVIVECCTTVAAKVFPNSDEVEVKIID